MIKNKVLFSTIAISVILLFCTAATTDSSVKTDSYVKDDRHYITKTFILNDEESISPSIDQGFELNGYEYHQIDIQSSPIIEVLSKDIEESAEVTLSSQNKTEVLSKLGATKEYTDNDGYTGILELDTESIQYIVSGYTTQTHTKTSTKMFYGLSSMDTSQITKSFWEGGVQLTLNDVTWIGDNNIGAGETAIGNNYNAKGSYSGTYTVKVPSSYIAKVIFKGSVEKEVSNETEYKITYLGEQSQPMETASKGNRVLITVVIVFVFFILLLIAVLMAVFIYKRNNTISNDVTELEDLNLNHDEEDYDEKN